MIKHRKMLFNPKFGAVGYISYLYFLIYELLSPFIEIFGVLTMLLAFAMDLINIPFMVLFFLIYAVFGSVLSLTAFFSRVYTSDLKVTFSDAVKAAFCVFLKSHVLGLFWLGSGQRLFSVIARKNCNGAELNAKKSTLNKRRKIYGT